jgi:hypothetical protein
MPRSLDMKGPLLQSGSPILYIIFSFWGIGLKLST